MRGWKLKHTSNYDDKLIDFLSQNGEVRRATICEQLGLKWTTVYDHLKRLELCDVVKRDIKKRCQKQGAYNRYLPGRPYTMWSVIKR